jgi:polysaccharide pyruvyl transferase WcaK-like protein
LGDKLSAAETKWVISRCAAFVGARTHSTIAAISSAVPTLSLAYSRKARGLNQDIFGSQEFCLQPTETTPTTVAERVSHLLERSDAIVKRLAGQLPENKKRALQGGAILRRLAESR